MSTKPTSEVSVGICVLNYHHPAETLDCVRSLLAKEPATTRILWLENEARLTRRIHGNSPSARIGKDCGINDAGGVG